MSMGISVFKKDIKSIYNQLKASAKKRNIPFELTLCDLNDLSFPITCPVFNIVLKYNTNKAEDDSFSIDRKDSSKGYTADNIIVVSNRANKLKSNATISELKQIYDFYKQFE